MAEGQNDREELLRGLEDLAVCVQVEVHVYEVHTSSQLKYDSRRNDGRRSPVTVKCIMLAPVSSEVEGGKDQAAFHSLVPGLHPDLMQQVSLSGSSATSLVILAAALARVCFLSEAN